MRKLIIAFCVLALLGGGAYTVFSRGSSGSSAVAATAAPSGPVRAGSAVTASARVVPLQYAELGFATGGTVASVPAKEGDQVAAGAVLAQLDDSAQRAKVAARETELAQAQANYDKLRQGATPEELRAAEAGVAQAQAQLRQTVSSVSPADVAAAQAQLKQAQAQLNRLRAGPNPADVRAAEAALQQAQQQLTTQRDTLSANKTGAQLQLDQAATALRQAQTSYSTAKWNWDQVQATGNDPVNPSVPDSSAPGKTKANKLNDAQKQQYYDAFVQAELALHSAEQVVEQRRVAFDTARQAEVSGVEAATQAVAAAQAQLDAARGSVTPDQIAGAQAQLASAQAELARLRGDQHAGAVDAAKAGVEQSRAQLDQLKAGPNQSDLTIAQAQVANAQAELNLEKVLLDQYVLRAPFAGTVAALDLRPNAYVAPGTVLIRIADVSSWQIETDDLTELKIANIRAGDPVTVTLDALPGVTFQGTLSRIRPFGEQKQGDIVYTATVALAQQDPRLRWNMTATVSIEPRPAQ